MSDIKKESLQKLGIQALNKMQVEAYKTIQNKGDILILSPTGTGKTLAFLLPILSKLDHSLKSIQCLIIAPSRELAMQIESVARKMGTGLKINVVYGGRPIAKDLSEINTPPALLIGTPGRILDHLKRDSITLSQTKYLVLDEFDKSLEFGFADEMSSIFSYLSNIDTKVLTSATQGISIPLFVPWIKPKILDHLDNYYSALQIKKVSSPSKDKLTTLGSTLKKLSDQTGIVFCNFKDSIARISDYLDKNEIPHGTFYGGMEQTDRERALVKFRNGTHRILLATDLAARGLDIPEIDFIIHYHLPIKQEEFIHRNGRTARMQADGMAYVLTWEEEQLPDYLDQIEEASLGEENIFNNTWTTLFISGGRRDKISKGDIAGLFFKKGELQKNELGIIELKQECAFVAVPKSKAKNLIKTLNNQRVKKRKVRIKEV